MTVYSKKKCYFATRDLRINTMFRLILDFLVQPEVIILVLNYFRKSLVFYKCIRQNEIRDLHSRNVSQKKLFCLMKLSNLDTYY